MPFKYDFSDSPLYTSLIGPWCSKQSQKNEFIFASFMLTTKSHELHTNLALQILFGWCPLNNPQHNIRAEKIRVGKYEQINSSKWYCCCCALIGVCVYVFCVCFIYKIRSKWDFFLSFMVLNSIQVRCAHFYLNYHQNNHHKT